MAHYYRAYLIGINGWFEKAVDLDCANDDAAKEAARLLVDDRDVELWQRDRRIKFLKPRNKAAPVVIIATAAWSRSGWKWRPMSELEPTPELPDNISIREVLFPDRIKDALFAAGIKTVGEVREMSDEALVALPDIGDISLAFLRETLGLPSTAGVRPTGKMS
jgi:hypothetical protein